MKEVIDLYGKPWTDREYIIVLYSYFKYHDKPKHLGSPFIKRLATMLGRTESSILMRMENFASLDVGVIDKRKGLTHISQRCYELFQKWSAKQESLTDCGEALIKDMRSDYLPTLFEPEPVKLPKVFGKYELMDLLGKGTFGSVYSCINTEEDKLYAMKLIHMHELCNEEVISRFRREINILKTINHPNVIKIHDDNLDSEKHYPAFVMDLAGQSLAEYLHEEAKKIPGKWPILPFDTSCQILKCILNAIKSMHDHQNSLIHRDINPHNILKSLDNNWILVDFSLAKFLAPNPCSLGFNTTSQRGWGTGYYAAPEQLRDFKNANQQADVYAAGRIMWDLFSKEPPPPRHEKERHGLPGPLAEIYFKAIAYDTCERYKTINDFINDFINAISQTEANG
jgi:serine/threonine protein kinase